jgi:hypothetical protein
MQIPRKKLETFVNDIVNQCFSSRQERANRGTFFQNYFMTGSSDQANAALFNKVYSSLDDLESLLFSPVSLRFHIGDPDIPNVLNEAKGRAAATRLRNYARKSETDTMISAATRVGLVKGKGFIKQLWKRGEFAPELVQPEDIGVLRENHTQLDEDMEAFSHSMLITPYQFLRLIENHPDKADLIKKGRRYTREDTGNLPSTQNASMQIVVGGLYPFQPAGMAPSGIRGTIVDWMSQPKPQLSPEVSQTLMELKETWVWDDDRQDWATFQSIGNDMLIMGKYQLINALGYDPTTFKCAPCLKGVHPFREFCTNPVDDYFWGRSEISHLVGLQEAINARITGTNKLLRLQEDPTTKFIGSTGVNQIALSRYQKPGGYWTDTNPQAKVERDTITIPQDIWASLQEYERMFDEIMGLPPTARGKSDVGVRSAAHANTLVRQFSPRFKDRALLCERNVEALGGLMLDMCRAHDDRKMTAWVPAESAGLEGPVMPEPLIIAPAKGLQPVRFAFSDLPDDVTLTVDSHSSSPAFQMDAQTLAFDLVKVGAMSPSDLVEHVDAPDPDELQMGIVRREIARAEQQKEAEKLQLIKGGKK